MLGYTWKKKKKKKISPKSWFISISGLENRHDLDKFISLFLVKHRFFLVMHKDLKLRMCPVNVSIRVESLFYSSQGIRKWLSIKCLKEMVLLTGIAQSQSGHNISYQRPLNGLICFMGLSSLCSYEKKLRTTSTTLELMHKPWQINGQDAFPNNIIAFYVLYTAKQRGRAIFVQ